MPEEETLETIQARLVAAQAELTGAKARLTEINNESAGHRVNASNARKEAERLQGERDAAVAEAAKKVSEAEAAAKAKADEAEAKITEATTAAQRRVIASDLKIAAKDAGAQDVADVLALLDMAKVKASETGDVENAAELMAELKKAKPYLFGGVSTSSTNKTPDPKPPAPKSAKDMTDEEFDQAMRSRAWRK
jgi:hypothetical protein